MTIRLTPHENETLAGYLRQTTVSVPYDEFRKLLFAYEKVQALEASEIVKAGAYQAAVKPVYDKWYGADEPGPAADCRVDTGAPTA